MILLYNFIDVEFDTVKGVQNVEKECLSYDTLSQLEVYDTLQPDVKPIDPSNEADRCDQCLHEEVEVFQLVYKLTQYDVIKR